MSAVAMSSTVQCMTSVSAKCHVDQGGNGCVSTFWAAEVFQRFGRWAQ